ncbi:DoxX family membrane protein [Maribacter sp. 2-571]|uniref:DoxX family membrane protein n=1 Tax=Maribacter sp. 2-571 TaxID=3417569 RepID=UPI003D343530
MEHLTANAAQLLLLVFLAITFLQSGIDKVVDWKGNLTWLTGHFAKSPLGNMVPLLLGTVLVAEIASGILCAIGLYTISIGIDSDIPFYGAVLSCISLLMLFFGQRMAKEYVGAQTIVIYLVPAVLLVYLLQQ